MIYIYTFLYFLLLLFYLPLFSLRFKWKKKEKLELRARLALALPPASVDQPCLWIHAVSVGEVLSLQNLLDKLKQLHPSWRVVLTSLTPAGIRLAREKLGSKAEIWPVPVDLPWCLNRFLKRIKPRVLALTESELWPNLIHVARRNSVRVIVINGRIGERSFRRMKKFRFLFLPILTQIDLFLVQSIVEKRRLTEIGLSQERIIVSGNLKTEIALPLFTEKERSDYWQKLGLSPGEKIITAGSTHPGEELILLRTFSKLKEKRPNLRLIIAPRHPSRWEEIAHLCSRLSLQWQRWSWLKNRNGTSFSSDLGWEVLIIDTLGDLPFFYWLADLTFIGGSLIKRGGHNLLEPAFYGKPIIFGPHMENFAFLAGHFLEREAALEVSGEEELLNAFLQIKDESFKKMGERAQTVLRELQGATERTIAILEDFMKRRENEEKN